MARVRFHALYWLIPLLALAGGCGNSQDGKLGTQVAAKVNADEITVHQIDQLLARHQNVTLDTAEQAKREILDKLIEQTLAKQQALKRQLDRSPGVMQAIEAGRSEILARAYLAQIAAAQPEPAASEVKEYYAAHPELFARRRIFNLEDFVVLPSEGLAAALRQQVAKTRSMPEIAAWLKSRNARFSASAGVRAAEYIPLELLREVQAMKDGELKLVESGGRLQVIRLVASEAAPMDEATAIPRIRQFLANQRAIEAIANEMKQLKHAARIEYASRPQTLSTAASVDRGVRGLR